MKALGDCQNCSAYDDVAVSAHEPVSSFGLALLSRTNQAAAFARTWLLTRASSRSALVGPSARLHPAFTQVATRMSRTSPPRCRRWLR
jgi:hypothetical protein